MVTSQFSLCAWLLLLGTASAVPKPTGLVARQGANPTDLWVTVDESGIPKTITPVLTTISGTPTLLSAAPYDVTATVWTKHPYGDLTTSTGPGQPKATNDKGAGAFAACRNTDGEFKPFCLPKNNDVYYPGSTHYVTWDPAFFTSSNTTIKVLGYYLSNDTDIPTSGPPSGEEEAFSSGNIAAGWGFYQWRLDKSLLTSQSAQAVNITLRIAALPRDGQAAQWLAGPTITLRYKPGPPPKKSKAPDTQALYVALPIVFGFAALMIGGTFFYTRQLRQIDVGAIVRAAKNARRRNKRAAAAGRHVGASRKDRARNKDKEQSIRLMDRQGEGSTDTEEEEEDWEDGWRHEVPGRKDSEAGMGGGTEEGSRRGKRVFDRLDRKRV
ncbi:hypothetical protein C8A03DRAFT_30284 [Achaetomium macrosporum]|uniref:Uncharacterized protein n=1 Tax=Achaetomium macrosporum TaxID=79813 RepID=A0AAN7CGF7_9PEZI|nr:hypothetical protein C8A03DRAFT_30284 [Achaetomium macrosporum]